MPEMSSQILQESMNCFHVILQQLLERAAVKQAFCRQRQLLDVPQE
jgi:hypothetical protein